MNAAISTLLAADERQDIRRGAIASIRASSHLDENIQRLLEALPGSAKVTRLADLLERLKPQQLDIIRAGKKNDDAAGLAKLKQAGKLLQEVEQLSQQLVDDERERLSASLAASREQGRKIIVMLGGFVLAGIVAGVLVSLFVASRITRPLVMIEKSMASVADGDLTISLNAGGRDEMGRTVNAISTTVGKLHGIIRGVMASSTMLARESGELTEAAGLIHDATRNIDTNVKQIREESTVALSATEEAIEHLDRAADECRAASETATTSARMIASAVEDFQRFQGNMEQTVGVTQELAEAAGKITQITNTIRSISEQTNLLALNEAIEAARAGEQGRGFAVVADEVRELAKRTSDATDQISGLIEVMSGSVDTTVASLEGTVNDSRSNIEHLQQAAGHITGNSEQAQQMYQGMKQVVSIMAPQRAAMQSISGAVCALSEMAEESARQVVKLNGLASDLSGEASKMQGMIKQFRV
ncbi:MAG TPA: methyl-accepting chemotaxis protein [Gammaproteobacteria bacterium]|nr:methyl-accepting chemotaxis protein [Gammaproteobacteria bacterium]